MQADLANQRNEGRARTWFSGNLQEGFARDGAGQCMGRVR